VVNKVKIAADTINTEVYLKQVLSGPPKESVVWAKADGQMTPVRTVCVLRWKGLNWASSIWSTRVPRLTKRHENRWAWVKDKIRRMPGHPSSLDELWASVEPYWN
jgi:hypothetical protein